MTAASSVAKGDPARPWDEVSTRQSDILLRAPRSSLPVPARYFLITAIGIAAVLSIRFAMIGAWPVILFSVLDIGGLAVALHLFARAPVPEDRIHIANGVIELTRTDTRGRLTRVYLPAAWTRLEERGRSEVDHDLWLVFRGDHHAIGRCVSAAGRRAAAPRIRAALAAAKM